MNAKHNAGFAGIWYRRKPHAVRPQVIREVLAEYGPGAVVRRIGRGILSVFDPVQAIAGVGFFATLALSMYCAWAAAAWVASLAWPAF